MDRQAILKQHKLSIPVILVVLGILTGILVLTHLFFTAYENPWLTLYARNFRSITAIFTTNFLHHDLDHLMNNLVAFWLLGSLALFSVGTHALKGMFWGALGCGLASWLFIPAGTIMIGFSGVVFSLIGILFISSVRSGQLLYIAAVCLIIWFMDAGFFDTIRPTEYSEEGRIAWQGHLGGFLR